MSKRLSPKLTSGSSNRDRVARKRLRSYTAAEDSISSAISALARIVLVGEIVDRTLPGLNAMLGLIVLKFFSTVKVSLLNCINHLPFFFCDARRSFRVRFFLPTVVFKALALVAALMPPRLKSVSAGPAGFGADILDGIIAGFGAFV